ncbi:class I SAM-dependent methyltransferase [Nonomuraea sp. NPDC046802]|uniref:class I SAM-dependent methyltransferase n=1 Tax=Nonomuraea sp. NPDC046802 TaxID=3154919 RepID=UPI003404D2FA
MATTLPAFTPLEETLYLTLVGRALDSRSPNPYLGDTTSDEVVSKIGYDLSKFPLPKSKIPDIAVRAIILDDVVRGFIARHPDAVVLDLGAGLDTRVYRVDPPPTVDWYDVDFPTVVKVREQVMPPKPNVHAIATDVTDLRWLEQVPTDRPAVIVADGLIGFVADADFTALLNRLTGHFPSGELALNTYPKYVIWLIKHFHVIGSASVLVRHGGFDDPHAPERWDPDLELVEEIFATRVFPKVATLPPLLRMVNRLVALSPALSRKTTTVVHYRF